MTTLRRMIKLTIKKADLAKLASIARSRTEPAGRVERARILLAYRKDPSFYAVGQALGLHAQTVQRCIERAKAEGALAALDERPRPGKEPTITVEAKTWVVALACRKAKELGYPHEVWTTRLLARHAREHGPAMRVDHLAELAGIKVRWRPFLLGPIFNLSLATSARTCPGHCFEKAKISARGTLSKRTCGFRRSRPCIPI